MGTEGLLRKIPSVDQLLEDKRMAELLLNYPRKLVIGAIREILDELRNTILCEAGAHTDTGIIAITEGVAQRLGEKTQSNLRQVINGTGVVLHTNLGRSLLCDSALEAVNRVALHYSNLEFSLATGKRGSRYDPVEELIKELTGAEAALVVNNNASAVLLSLSTLAKGKEVIVSRGQLVEIGGSFRIPEVMEQSGCKLVEVGSTNKTHPSDYTRAITEDTSLLLQVHTSNYRIVGFTRETSVAEMVAIGHERNIPVMSDLGSGVLIDLTPYGLGDEPTVQSVVKQGSDVITFSGDKLLGGPQAGIIVGKEKYINLMKRNPLNRAIRIDKMTVAALEATLRVYQGGKEVALEKIPTLNLLTLPLDELHLRAKRLCGLLNENCDDCEGIYTATTKQDLSAVGGGAMPLAKLRTYVVSIKPSKVTVNTLTERLRKSKPAVVGKVQDDSLYLDVRTIAEEEFNDLCAALKKALGVIA